MRPGPSEILEQRLTAEAKRRGEPIEIVREAILLRGLDAAQRERQARAIAADIVLVMATSTEQHELEQAAKDLGLGFNAQRGRVGDYFQLGNVGANRVAAMRVSIKL